MLGREFSARDPAATAELAPDRVFEALREALAASIIVEGVHTVTLRFSHVLLRDRSYALLAPSAREALHWRAGLVSLAGGAEPESVIHHLFEARAAGSPEKIAEVALAAAQSELSRLAFEDAARIGRRALALGATSALPARVDTSLRLVVAEAAIRRGDGAAGKQLCSELAELAERGGMTELLARAALVYGTELASGRIDPTMVSLLRRALAGLGDERSPLCAPVMARLAAALTPPIEPTDAVEIVALMRGREPHGARARERHTLLYVLQFGDTVALLVPEHERFAMMSETLELARALGQPLVLLATLPAYITTLLARGERERAEAELPAYDALIADFRQPLQRLRRGLVEALLCALSGDFDAAERARQARDLARRDASGTGTRLWLTHRLSLAQLLAGRGFVAAEASALLAQFEAMPSASRSRPGCSPKATRASYRAHAERAELPEFLPKWKSMGGTLARLHGRGAATLGRPRLTLPAGSSSGAHARSELQRADDARAGEPHLPLPGGSLGNGSEPEP